VLPLCWCTPSTMPSCGLAVTPQYDAIRKRGHPRNCGVQVKAAMGAILMGGPPTVSHEAAAAGLQKSVCEALGLQVGTAAAAQQYPSGGMQSMCSSKICSRNSSGLCSGTLKAMLTTKCSSTCRAAAAERHAARSCWHCRINVLSRAA
jgi:hypothetical protein